jgi:hypothetical protein
VTEARRGKAHALTALWRWNRPTGGARVAAIDPTAIRRATTRRGGHERGQGGGDRTVEFVCAPAPVPPSRSQRLSYLDGLR